MKQFLTVALFSVIFSACDIHRTIDGGNADLEIRKFMLNEDQKDAAICLASPQANEQNLNDISWSNTGLGFDYSELNEGLYDFYNDEIGYSKLSNSLNDFLEDNNVNSFFYKANAKNVFGLEDFFLKKKSIKPNSNTNYMIQEAANYTGSRCALATASGALFGIASAGLATSGACAGGAIVTTAGFALPICVVPVAGTAITTLTAAITGTAAYLVCSTGVGKSLIDRVKGTFVSGRSKSLKCDEGTKNVFQNIKDKICNKVAKMDISKSNLCPTSKQIDNNLKGWVRPGTDAPLFLAISAIDACISARKRVMNCYNDPDQGHKTQLDELYSIRNRCQSALRNMCQAVIIPSKEDDPEDDSEPSTPTGGNGDSSTSGDGGGSSGGDGSGEATGGDGGGSSGGSKCYITCRGSQSDPYQYCTLDCADGTSVVVEIE